MNERSESGEIGREDRAFAVGVSIGVSVVLSFLGFIVTLAVAGVENFFPVLLLWLVFMLLSPFLYLFLGRQTALLLEETRNETYSNEVKPWTKAEVVQISSFGLVVTVPLLLWYFCVQFFNNQWSVEAKPSPQVKAHPSRSTHIKSH